MSGNPEEISFGHPLGSQICTHLNSHTFQCDKPTRPGLPIPKALLINAVCYSNTISRVSSKDSGLVLLLICAPQLAQLLAWETSVDKCRGFHFKFIREQMFFCLSTYNLYVLLWEYANSCCLQQGSQHDLLQLSQQFENIPTSVVNLNLHYHC